MPKILQSTLIHNNVNMIQTLEGRTPLRPVIEEKASPLLTIFLVVVAIFAMCWLWGNKVQMVGNVLVHPVLWAYIAFVSAFHLSRIPCSMLYEYSVYRVLQSEAESGADRQKYEPKVTFVIPCKNEEAAIMNTLMECFAADYPSEKLEVIVINDGSTDNTLGVLTQAKCLFPNLVIVDWKENRGKRHGMAEGFRLATGEIVVLIDSDSYLDRSSLRELVRPFVDPSVGAVCAHAEPANAPKNLLTRMQSALYFQTFRMFKAAESVFSMVLCCSGCSSAYRRSAVVPIIDRFLAESFLGLPVTWGDDRSLTNWMIREGYKTLYTHQARAWTIVPDTLRSFMKQQIRWRKGWFVNSQIATRFICQKSPLVAVTYFFPLLIINILAPVILFRVIFTFITQFTPDLLGLYVFGLFLVSTPFAAYYRWLNPRNRYWPYIYIWALYASLINSWLILYAVATIQNRKWGTR